MPFQTVNLKQKNYYLENQEIGNSNYYDNPSMLA